MPRDDARLAAASRALRRRQGLTQTSVVGRGHSRRIPSLIEGGKAGEIRVDELRAYFTKLGATVRVTAWYDGATLDRLVDAAHASVVESAVAATRRAGWQRVDTEVSFNRWGERGSIDFLGVHEESRAILIGEAKSAWGSLEETLRSLDIKVRLGPAIANDRLGWQPKLVGVVLAFPEDGAARRIANRFSATLLSSYPDRNLQIRKWLRHPSGALRGLWFLSDVRRGVLDEE